MDGVADLEMPSPKRLRLELVDPKESRTTLPPVDDMNYLYNTPPAGVQTPMAVPKQVAKQQEKPTASAISCPIHLPGLSGFDYSPPKLDASSDADRMNQNIQNSYSVSVRAEERSGFQEDEIGDNAESEATHGISLEQANGSPTAESLDGGPQPERRNSQTGCIETEDLASKTVNLDGDVLPTTNGTQLDGNPRKAVNELSENSLRNDIRGDEFLINGDQQLEDTSTIRLIETQREEVQVKGFVQDANGGSEQKAMERKISDRSLPKVASVSPAFEELAESNKSNASAEFELDSSPYESSSSSDSSTDTSSSDGSDDGSGVDDYEMLSPEEEARRLMAEDGGTEEKVTSGGPRTLNEKPEDLVPKPDVTITADMKLEELGCVEGLVENQALIKAKTSGEYQVLESGSVLCLEDRTVIGAVSETLGRVQQPYYSVRFTNPAAMSEAGVDQGTRIFYVSQFSTTVFTQPLKAFKGSDASNLHDEEVGDDELEFSDDEAEAEHKRQVKQQKRARYDSKHGQKDGFSRGSQQRPGKPNNHFHERSNPLPERPPNTAEPSLNYDDAAEDSDELYTPLSRPSDLHMMSTSRNGPTQNQPNNGNNPKFGRGRGRGDRGEGRGRHRGNRGTGRGGRDDRRSQKSFFEKSCPPAHSNPGQGPFTGPQNGDFKPSSNNLPPRPPPQSNSFHSHPQSHHPQMHPPSYPTHSSPPPQSHTNYPFQPPPSYGQSYPQQYHQPQYSQDPYLQGISRQGYHQQQALPPNMQYPVQQTSPTPPSAAAIPPGAHINPNFFRQQAQSPSQSWQQQQGQASFPPPQYQPYQQPPTVNGTAVSPGPLSPEAARRLQENLSMLRNLNGGAGPCS